MNENDRRCRVNREMSSLTTGPGPAPAPAPDAVFEKPPAKKKSAKTNDSTCSILTVCMVTLLCFAFLTAGTGFVRDVQFHDRIVTLEQAIAKQSACPPCTAGMVTQVRVPGPIIREEAVPKAPMK